MQTPGGDQLECVFVVCVQHNTKQNVAAPVCECVRGVRVYMCVCVCVRV